jgi:branched-chain amino acid transport system substrate-binding protein
MLIRHLLLCLASLLLSPITARSDLAPIRIGWIGPLTGPAAALGVDSVPAIQLVFEEVNSKGGIQGQKLELVVEDDQYQTSKTVSAFERLNKQEGIDTFFIITYGGLFAISKSAERSGALLIDPLDCDDQIAALPKNVVCVAKKSEDLGFTNADYAAHKNLIPAALIYFEGDPFMGTVARASIERIKENGGSIAYADGYSAGTTDFKTQLLKIKESPAKSIFFYGYDEMGIAMKQARNLGITTQFFAMNTITSPGFVSSAGDSANGSFVGSWLAPPSEKLEGFFSKFVKKVGRKPFLEISTIPSYDVAQIMVGALAGADLKRRPSEILTDAMYSTKDYEGLSGNISVDSNGIVRSLKNYMFQFQNGELNKVPDLIK